MKAILKRMTANNVQTTGYILLLDDSGRERFACMCLELPWLNNQQSISCIPVGIYECARITSPKLGTCYMVKDVKNRTSILIHCANMVTELRGCIAIGRSLGKMNNDDYYDLFDSISTMNTFQKIAGSKFTLEIIS